MKENYLRDSKGKFIKGEKRKLSTLHKARISLSHKGKVEEWQRGKNHYYWKGGKPKCTKCGKQLVSYKAFLCKGCTTKKRWAKMKKNSRNEYDRFFKKVFSMGRFVQSRIKKPTSIEKKLYEELKNRKLFFEPQKPINNRFIVDAYIPSLNLIIEADGDYWHSLPKVAHKDKAENAYLTKCGFNLLRLSETEINNGSFKERMVSYIG